MAVFMLKTCKLSRSILMSEMLKLTNVKLGCINVDDNSERINPGYSQKRQNTDSSQSFLDELGISASQFMVSHRWI